MKSGPKEERLKRIKKRKLDSQQEGLSLDSVDFEEEKYIRESKHCLDIFPEEVWMLITEPLDPTILENLSNASPFFRRLLFPQRVYFMFPKVWKILAVKYHDPNKQSEEDEDSYFHSWFTKNARRRCPCGQEWNLQWYSKILKLRLVCKTWSNTIDRFYQNRPYYFEIRDSINDNMLADTSLWTDNGFSDDAFTIPFNHECFIKHFEKSHGTGNEERSPFLSRRCYIQLGESDETEANFENEFSGQLLAKYGHHIWYCTLDMTRRNVTITPWYTTLRSFLEKMPNLKELLLRYRIAERLVDSVSAFAQLEETINLSPLPTLYNLQRVKTENLPAKVFQELLRRNGHVSSLEVARRPPTENPEIYKLPLPNLKELRLYICSGLEFRGLESSQESCRLEKLTLAFFYTRVTWPRLFTLLENKWGSTLTHVDLSLPETTGKADSILKECGFYRLNLPKIKSFKVIIKEVSSLDFILPMKNSLEYLGIAMLCKVTRGCKLYQSVVKEQVIQFFGYYDLLLQSNIWTIFPKLQQIDLLEDWGGNKNSKVTHTRMEWQNENKMKLMKEHEKRSDVATQTGN